MTGTEAPRTRYPDLTSQPWHDPTGLALARSLEDEYPAIRRELLAFDLAAFHSKREPIRRHGAWDVLFLYQRGKKHPDVCTRCPITTQIVEAHTTLRAPAGLIYVSRLATSSHVVPHRGPTNVRLRRCLVFGRFLRASTSPSSTRSSMSRSTQKASSRSFRAILATDRFFTGPN